jgi:plasmid maintenance system antidote protein VapI
MLAKLIVIPKYLSMDTRKQGMPKGISTARGREFGEGLRAALERASLPARRIAEIVGWHESKVSHIVNGKGGATEQEVAILLGACRELPEEREYLLELYRDTDVRGWWQEHGEHPPVRLRTMIEHVRISKSIVSWQANSVPYFLRTPAYMSAVAQASANIRENEIGEHVTVQGEVQRLIWNRPGAFYVHESALLLPVGGPSVHVEQLEALYFAADLPMVTIKVVPVEAGAHAGLNGSFTKLVFDQYEPIVWLGHENSDLFVENPGSISGYERAIKLLDLQSLDLESSKSMIKKIATGGEA